MFLALCASVAAITLAASAGAASGISSTAKPKYYAATNYQINAAHTGLAPGSALPKKMKQLWAKNFGRWVSNPVILGNRVFVAAVPAGNTEFDVHVYGFDKRTGRSLWKPVELGYSMFSPTLAYGEGRLVVLNGDARIRGIDPATGRVKWARFLGDPGTPPDLMFAEKPVTVRAGVVYIETDHWGITPTPGNTYTALSVATGKIKWVKRRQLGALAPAVGTARIYFVDDCERDSFTLSGRKVWARNPLGCEGGVSGEVAVLAAGRVYVTTQNSGNLVLSSKTGLEVGRYTTSSLPVIVGQTAFLTYSNPAAPWEVWLQATDRVTGALRWSRQPDLDTYGQIVGTPIATTGVIYIETSSGRVFGYSTLTGKQVWTGTTGVGFDPQSVNLPTSAAIGGGVLAIRWPNRLTVFG